MAPLSDRFIAFQMNCFFGNPASVHILNKGEDNEKILSKEEFSQIINERHPVSGFISTHMAAISHRHELLRLLLLNGAEVDTPEWIMTQSPLMKALRYKAEDEDIENQIQTIKILLLNGAKIDFVDQFGETALDLAINSNNIRVVEYLEHEILRTSSRATSTDHEKESNGRNTPEAEEVVEAMKINDLPRVQELLKTIDPDSFFNGTPLGFHVNQLPTLHRWNYLDIFLNNGFKINSLDNDQRHFLEYVFDEMEDDGSHELLQYVNLIVNDQRIDLYFKLPDGHSLYHKIWLTKGFCANELRNQLDREIRSRELIRQPVPEIWLSRGIHYWMMQSADRRDMNRINNIIKTSAECLNTRDWRDYSTPLHIAAEQGFDVIIKTILDSHANPDENAQDGMGMTPLMRCFVRFGAFRRRGYENFVMPATIEFTKCHFNCILNLLRYGNPDLNKTDIDGSTALHYGVLTFVRQMDKGFTPHYKEMLSVITTLVNQGAAITISNNFNQTPLQLAQNMTKPDRNLMNALQFPPAW